MGPHSAAHRREIDAEAHAAWTEFLLMSLWFFLFSEPGGHFHIGKRMNFGYV